MPADGCQSTGDPDASVGWVVGVVRLDGPDWRPDWLTRECLYPSPWVSPSGLQEYPSRPRVTLPIEAPVELSEHTAAATLSVDTLLEQAVELGASDLHLTVGIPPVVRRRGHIEVLQRVPGARPRSHAPADLPHHDDRAAEASGARPAARLRLRHPRRRPLPRQRLLSAREPRGRVPHDPHADQARSRSSACPRASTSWPRIPAVSSSSPGRPAPVSRRRSRRSSTRSTAAARITSSRSRIRSSSCTITRAASSTSARSARTQPGSPTRSAEPSGRTRT